MERKYMQGKNILNSKMKGKRKDISIHIIFMLTSHNINSKITGNKSTYRK